MRVNVKGKDHRVDESTRLAGGYGPYAAKQDAESLLRRSVMACLMWEDNFYEDGALNAENIKQLVPLVRPQVVFDIAVEARTKQKLRHVPLLLAREMARSNIHKWMVSRLLPKIILRADELAEFLAIYWQDGRQPVSKQVKLGLADAFRNFDAYQLAKYNRDNAIKLRDVAFIAHVKAGSDNIQSDIFGRNIARLVNKKYYPDSTKSARFPVKEAYGLRAYEPLPAPDTWEVSLSTGKDKRETWTRLINDHKLGALAFLRNLRNMDKANVPYDTVAYGFQTINPKWLLPLNYMAAATAAPNWQREIENLMYAGFSGWPKLPGRTILIVDVSGSMMGSLGYRSDFTRLDAAAAMVLLCSEMCEHVSIYTTAGNDYRREHKTELVPPYRGFALCKAVTDANHRLGGGGIFTRQALEYTFAHEKERPERIVVFSDSQDCDLPHRQIPKPFGKHNYIIDVSSHSHGINYKGIWDAEISGWSEHFIQYIMGLEGLEIVVDEG